MKKREKREYDIFISYRRDGGESTAKILRDKLTELGYSVFFDVESLRSGDFNKKLYQVIEECEDFILVLSPGALERCVNKDDWVRLEISHALKHEKNVIPILLRGFVFPEELPEDIAGLRYKNGIESNYQFFDAFIEKLRGFLKAKPAYARGRSGKRLKAAAIIAGALCLILLGAVLAIRKPFGSVPYPHTEEERNLVGNLTYYAQTNLSLLEAAADCMDGAYRECETYLSHFDTASEEAVLAELEKVRLLLYGIAPEKGAMGEALRIGIMDSPFSAADAEAMNDYLREFCAGAIDDLYYMEYVMDKETYLDLSVREDVLESYRSIMEEELRLMAYCTNQMFLPVEDEEAIRAFKYDYLPSLYYIPLSAQEWLTNRETLESAQEGCWTSIEKSMERIRINIGDGNMELMEQKAELAESYIQAGMSPEEAERRVAELAGQAALTAQKEAELSDMEAELDAMLAEAREKFAPAPEDDPDTLWGKMLRFLNLGLYDDAIACAEMAGERLTGTDPYADAYTEAVIRFIENIPVTGIDYGLMVVGYDPAEKNEIYEIGDVVISLNGVPCRSFAEYEEQKEQAGTEQAYSVTVLRNAEEDSGTLEEVQLQLDARAPKVALREVSEKY